MKTDLFAVLRHGQSNFLSAGLDGILRPGHQRRQPSFSSRCEQTLRSSWPCGRGIQLWNVVEATVVEFLQECLRHRNLVQGQVSRD